MKITYQGHASLKINTDDGKTVYVDPYVGEGYDEPADFILVSHEHFDHTAVDKPAKKENTTILRAHDFFKDGQYLKKDLGGLEITAVEAYNENHPRGSGVGFVLEADGKKVYIAGDTAQTETMGKLDGIDLAFLPVDGIFTMNTAEATRCAELIGAKKVVPYHTSPGNLFDEEVAERFNTPNKLILKPGQSVEV